MNHASTLARLAVAVAFNLAAIAVGAYTGMYADATAGIAAWAGLAFIGWMAAPAAEHVHALLAAIEEGKHYRPPSP